MFCIINYVYAVFGAVMHARCDRNHLIRWPWSKLDNLVVEIVVCANSGKQVLVLCKMSQYTSIRSRVGGIPTEDGAL
jgi:hypothetical protein